LIAESADNPSINNLGDVPAGKSYVPLKILSYREHRSAANRTMQGR
jgi:hypothetical protein